jgi:hypothetical protein
MPLLFTLERPLLGDFAGFSNSRQSRRWLVVPRGSHLAAIPFLATPAFAVGIDDAYTIATASGIFIHRIAPDCFDCLSIAARNRKVGQHRKAKNHSCNH